ncbi:MAG: hypothetical protein WC047_08460 [Kiritimatiellales bacterium]
MELLPQVKIKTQKHDQREAEVFRKLRVGRALAKEEKELDEIVKNIEPEKLKKKREFQEFHQNIEKRKSQLLGEIKALEEKRDSAMQPFYELKFAANEAMDAVQTIKEKVRAEAKRVNTLRTTLETAKDDMDKKSELLAEKEQKIAALEISWIERDGKLQENEALFVKNKEAFESQSTLRASELDAKDRDIKARESSIEAKLAIIESKEKELADQRAHITSQQATLKLAFDEARRKGIL